VGSILEECHAPCKLNSYVDFEKRVGGSLPLQRLVFRPYPTLRTFSVALNVVGPVHPPIAYFYVVFIDCVVLDPVRNIAEILLAGQ
jgi:hypothetical protein